MPEDRTILEPSANVPGRQPFAVTIVEGATEGSNVAGATIVEALVGDGPVASASVNLIAGGHFLTYRLVEPIKVASGEADLWLADGDGRRVVMKLYRWGVRPKAEIVEKLGTISRERIVEVYERGIAPDGRNYEVLEYIRHGSLADLGRGGLAEATVRVVLTELCDAVAALHNVGILHRDLKPANILVRTLDPLDLVLTDFGISSVTDVSLHATSANRTAAYSAPEALTGVVCRASDWWSIGVILLELLSGRHPFEGIDERVVNFTLVTRGITVPENLPDGWGTLIRGLLTRDHAQRWGEQQVRAWLSGRRDIPVHYADASFESAPAAGLPHKPYKFRNQDYSSPAELAVALAEHPDEGMKHLGRGFLTQWVKDDVKDFDLASRLMDVMEDQRLTAEQKLTVAVLAMNAQLPLTWHGDVLNREWLTGNVELAVRLLESSVPDWLEKLREDRWLVDLREHRRTLLSDLKPYDSLMDYHVLDMLILTGDEKAQEIAAEVMRAYVGSTNDQINCLFSKTVLNSPEAILLAGSQRKLLLTPEQSLMSEVRKKADEAGVKLDSEKLAQVAKMEPDQLAEALGQLQQQYVDSTNPRLAALLKQQELDVEDALILLSCKEQSLLTVSNKYLLDAMRYLRNCGVEIDWNLAKRLIEANDWQEIQNERKKTDKSRIRSWHKQIDHWLNAETLEYLDAVALTAASPVYFAAPGSKRWEFVTGGKVWSSPAIGEDGMVYIGSFDGKIYALDGQTGTKRWEFATKGKVLSSPAIGDHGVVYVGGADPDTNIYALDGQTGELRWKYATGGVIGSSPAIGPNQKLYVGSVDKKMYCFDSQTGFKHWEFLTRDKVWSSPAVGIDGTIYFGSYDGSVYALDGDTGVKRWEFVTAGAVQSSPAIGADGTVYVGSFGKKIYALDGKTGAKRWERATWDKVYSSPVVDSNGTVYLGSFGSFESGLYALDARTGKRLWGFSMGQRVVGSALLGADGTIYIGVNAGRVFALDSRTGVQRWTFLAKGAVAASPNMGADGTLYVGSMSGKVYAVWTDSGGNAQSPWPMFRQNRAHSGRAISNVPDQGVVVTSIRKTNLQNLIVAFFFFSIAAFFIVTGIGILVLLFSDASAWPLNVVLALFFLGTGYLTISLGKRRLGRK